MTDDLEHIRKDFEAFRKECIWCAVVFNTHQQLFHSDDAITDLLHKTAGWFFHDYSVISQEYSVVLVGRLTEHSGKDGKRNLSIDYIAEELCRLSRSTDEVENLRKGLVAYRDRIEPSRHKLVAHRDVRTIRNAGTPASWPIEEVHQFLENLNAFCDNVAPQIGLMPSDFLHISSSGDASDLIKLLRKASNA